MSETREVKVDPPQCPINPDHCWHFVSGFRMPCGTTVCDDYKCCWCGGRKEVRSRLAFMGMVGDAKHGDKLL